MPPRCCSAGSLWQPNISLALVSAVRGRSALAVSFSADGLCEDYIVIVSCSASQHFDRVHRVRSHRGGQSNASVLEEYGGGQWAVSHGGGMTQNIAVGPH